MTHANTMLRGLLILLLLLGPGGPGLRAAEPVDMSEFLRRAESIGLSTHFLRRLLQEIEVHAGNPGGGAEAAWGYIRGRITIREDLLEEERRRVPFDLEIGPLGTIFHELTHAANSRMADPKQPRISPAGSHHAVVEEIWADLFSSEEQTAFLGLPRYPRVKADEVTGYFMAHALGELFQDVNALVSSNKLAPGLVVQAPGDAARLGGKILAPAESVMLQDILKRRYGEVHLKDRVFFQGRAVSWTPERRFLKHEMWDKFLALHPPSTGAELLESLNSLDNAWIRSVRAEIAAARKAHEEKLQELPSSSDLAILGVE
jgi:hypothetical protein